MSEISSANFENTIAQTCAGENCEEILLFETDQEVISVGRTDGCFLLFKSLQVFSRVQTCRDDTKSDVIVSLTHSLSLTCWELEEEKGWESSHEHRIHLKHESEDIWQAQKAELLLHSGQIFFYGSTDMWRVPRVLHTVRIFQINHFKTTFLPVPDYYNDALPHYNTSKKKKSLTCVLMYF